MDAADIIFLAPLLLWLVLFIHTSAARPVPSTVTHIFLRIIHRFFLIALEFYIPLHYSFNPFLMLIFILFAITHILFTIIEFYMETVKS